MIPYQSGQLGLSQARAAEGLYTDQGVFVPFSAVQLQTTFQSSYDDVSSYVATGAEVGTITVIDPGAGPFGSGDLYNPNTATFPYRQYVTFTRASQQGLGGATEFTVEAWIKPEGGRGYIARGIVGQYTATINQQYLLYNNGITGSEISLSFTIRRSAGVVSSGIAAAGSGVTLGAWHHIRVTGKVNSGSGLLEIRWYVDGVYKTVTTHTSSPIVENPNTVLHQVGIMNVGTGSESRFPGWIGPIRVIKDYALNSNTSNFATPSTYFPVY